MNTDRRTLVYVALIFLSGLLVGGTLMNLAEHFVFHRHPREETDIRRHQVVAQEMSKRLHLDARQQAQVDEILRDAVHDYQQVQQQVQPEFDQVRQQGRQRIRQILNDEQRAEFDRIVASVEAQYPIYERPATIPVPQPGGPQDVSHITPQ